MIQVIKDFFIRFRMPITLCATLIGVAVMVSTQAMASTTVQQSGRLLTIHDQGVEKVIATKAHTVGEALKKADVEVGALDSVEPAIDTELVANNYSINVYRARPVTVVDGETQVRIMTPHQSARQIAKAANMELYDEDQTELGRVEDVLEGGAGLKLTIDRATPFSLKLYGKKITARTQATTVEEMLKEKNITLGPNDGISVKPSTLIKKGMKIEIWRNGKQTVTEEQDVAFAVEKIEDADREIGYHEVKTPGEPGKKTVTYEIVMKNGKEVSRKEIQSVVTKQPKKQVEIVGAKSAFSGSFADALAQLRACEGDYTTNTGNGYYGAYQYDIQTWGGYQGYPNASVAPPAVQDQKAWETYQRRGWSPWPNCGANLPDTFR
jgi:resuscitation-promoting factor RpfB